MTEVFIERVERKVWGPGDDYLVIPLSDIQVMEEEGWKENEKVKVTVIIEREGK